MSERLTFRGCKYYGRDGYLETECFKCHEYLCPNHALAIEQKIKTDNVNHPAHYTDGKIEVIDYIEDKKLGFCLGNAVKYISRAGKKDKSKEVEDLKKAIWYIERRIKELSVENA